MARAKEQITRIRMTPKHMRTSIGYSKHSRPKNKHKRRASKNRYRGQGK